MTTPPAPELLDAESLLPRGFLGRDSSCGPGTPTDIGVLRSVWCELTDLPFPALSIREHEDATTAVEAFETRRGQSEVTDCAAPRFEGRYLVRGTDDFGSIRCHISTAGSSAERAVIEWHPDGSAFRFILFASDQSFVQIHPLFSRIAAPEPGSLTIVTDEEHALIGSIPEAARGRFCAPWGEDEFAATLVDVYCRAGSSTEPSGVRLIRFVTAADARASFDPFPSTVPDCWGLGSGPVSGVSFPVIEIKCRQGAGTGGNPYSVIYWLATNTAEFGYIIHWDERAGDTATLVEEFRQAIAAR